MDVVKVAILGVIQGLTEFLPVSSSGHLVLTSKILNMKELPIYLNLIMHTGTLTSVCFYFRKDITKIVEERHHRLLVLLAVATLPAALAGVAFKDFFEGFFSEPRMVLMFMSITGLILIAGELIGKKNKNERELSGLGAFFVGTMQAVAILPGISRSGSTISAGLFSGLKREEAARFAFLLSIPIIIGTAVFEIKDAPLAADAGRTIILGSTGFVFSALAGFAAIAFLMRMIKTHSLYPFAVYCIVVSVIGLLVMSL